MAFPKSVKDLCAPAMFYFYISIFVYILTLIQNFGILTSYKIGIYSCNCPNTIILFIAKLVYILFWTYILNLICKDGYTTFSWLLVLLPFLLFFVLIGLILINFNSDIYI